VASVDKKLCTAEEAVTCVNSGDTFVSEGFTLFIQAEALTAALEKRFLETGEPKDLTLIFVAMHGITNTTGGISHLAHKGLLKRVIGGYYGWYPEFGKLALEKDFEAYNIPQGVISQLFRDIAADRPGCITHVGLDTFIDPEYGGGKLIDNTLPDIIEKIYLNGKPYLWYKSFPIDIAFLSATACDKNGNLIFSNDPIVGESLAVAQAVRNSGGTVIAQVGKIVDEFADPGSVTVPGIFVDRIVEGRPHEKGRVYRYNFKSGFCRPKPAGNTQTLAPIEMCARRIIAERACSEIPDGAIVNLGIGMPEEIARIASEKNLLDNFTMTVESGPIGGAPAGGLCFGASLYPDAIIDAPAQFDFYDGGGLDYAALGAAQIDASGNVNVSKFAGRLAGVGGFINISQTAKKVVFCSTFTASGLEIEVHNKRLKIVKEGKIKKFLPAVEQISFSAKRALINNQEILYITERAVFKLVESSLELIEIAPGIELKDLMGMLDFEPVIKKVKTMDVSIFQDT
jgi:propionate CoA-transferase